MLRHPHDGQNETCFSISDFLQYAAHFDRTSGSSIYVLVQGMFLKEETLITRQEASGAKSDEVKFNRV